MSQVTTSAGNSIGGLWETKELPDSEITVLMRVDDDEYPIWPGFHDGEHWRYADATRVDEGDVLGWLHLEEAVEYLDQLVVAKPADAK